MWTPADRALVGDFGAGQALTDDQFGLLEPLIPPARPGGRPRSTDIRNLLDGLFYLVRTGCQWRHLPPPPAFPPWRTVYGYMRGRVARISGTDAMTPPPLGVMRCGRTPGVQAPTCGSEHGRQRPPRSLDAGPCASAARHRSPV